MSWMSMSQESGQGLANLLAAGRPSVGKTVRVTRGRKHLGKEGTVFWHGPDQFNKSASRYGSPFEQDCRKIRGVYGFRVGVQTADGEKFFIDASHIEIVEAKAQENAS